MVGQFVAELQGQIRFSWTVGVPTKHAYGTYLDVSSIMPRVRTQVDVARRSEAFQIYLASVSKRLGGLGLLMEDPEPTIAPVSGTSSAASSPGFISAASLFARPAPCIDYPQPNLFPALCTERRESGEAHRRLSALVDDMSGMDGLQDHQISYLADLRRSMASTQPDAQYSVVVSENDTSIQEVLGENLQRARDRYDAVLHQIRLASTGTSIAHQICTSAGLAARQLQSQPPERRSDLGRELRNPGDHDNGDWDPVKFPENLVLEIEQGIMIRPVQNRIAAIMRSPPEMRSSVMQLNMGEGKSSVIVPVVAAALADGNRLVRVVVAKPQSSQMTHMLIDKLGRLINRRVFYLPISRGTPLHECDVKTVRQMMGTCQRDGGVLLLQPEHLLSFKLMGLDKSWAGEGEMKSVLGQELIRLYQDMKAVSRDIVDESDDNFSVKFELIYTMGTQEAIDMTPDRWTLAQELLGKTEAVVRGLIAAKEPMPWVSEGLLFEDHGPGRFATIRVLGEAQGRQLIRALATVVCDSGLRGFPVHHQTVGMRQAVLNYIATERLAEDDIATVKTVFFGDARAKNALLLLRGLLAKGVILFALRQKRFRVNYGLALDRRPRTMLAVPYRAKDMPSPRSEFSQPDVAIVLTCLAYYYRGLSTPSSTTVSSCSPSFRHFSSLNPKDRSQCEDMVFPALKDARSAIDFYLARVVFPREMKQFPLKLSASGWDLAKPKNHPLTGFSGTNDSKGVLPLSVVALDVQPHTNAAVLSTLLREENTVVELDTQGRSQLAALTETMLLEALRGPGSPIRVILDVGAQMVESNNVGMARKLLDAVPTSDADAAIFFSDGDDELSVLTREGAVDAFLTSPVAAHTGRCLVFLDQAHTRGTDLKLPDTYRAAVTLGPGVTKDTLVQACMRMRKLGRGQSITFLVSPEMGKRIRSFRNIADGRPLAVHDVLVWAISETWDEAVRSVPLWATQGVRHLGQEAIWQEADEPGGFTTAHVQRYLEPEAASVEQRYGVAPAGARDVDEITAFLASGCHPGKARRFRRSTARSSVLSALDEEQERELAPEMEQERQLARPPPQKALPHALGPDLVTFVHTGRIPAGSTTFLPCYAALSKSSAAVLFRPGLSNFPGNLLVTQDFARTVRETGPAYCSDCFQRDVGWVLSGGGGDGYGNGEPKSRRLGNAAVPMMVVSQWEASRLKPVIESLQRQLPSEAKPPSTLQAYLPRPSLTFRTMEDLDTYVVPAAATGRAVPRESVMQLNLFAGQLYLRCYREYLRLCRHLGLAHAANNKDDVIAPNGFIGKQAYPECEFDASPVAFLDDMYKKIRNDGVGIDKTHMGRIFAGDILTFDDFTGEACGCLGS
ncbi:ubiquitinyl hydrolase 1 [Madurella fahalii]|uniref:ubiquitinyl hydrolase 1 n=1 Tax=Madurella fahalii TaxID=1157608 RepID=A0ABQ0GAF9_9PEZI